MQAVGAVFSREIENGNLSICISYQTLINFKVNSCFNGKVSKKACFISRLKIAPTDYRTEPLLVIIVGLHNFYVLRLGSIMARLLYAIERV